MSPHWKRYFSTTTNKGCALKVTIFKYEMKQLKGAIIIWTISLFLVILIILPVYIGMMSAADTIVLEGFGGNPMLEAMGVTLDVIATPLGTYAFLTFYVFLACAINGMNMGLKIITKEYMQKTADFIREIAAASNEQSNGAEQISKGVNDMDSVVQNNAASSEELASTAEQLSGQAIQMNEITNYFKLESDYLMIEKDSE